MPLLHRVYADLMLGKTCFHGLSVAGGVVALKCTYIIEALVLFGRVSRGHDIP